MPSVGFVGAGRMGLPMALNLLKAGFDVTVVDRRSEVEAQVRPAGAAWSPSVAEMAERVGVVITMLPDAIMTIAAASEGMPFMPSGATWIDMGSSSPETGRRLARLAARHDLDLIDAPVGGGPAEAAAGSLQLFVGGDESVVTAKLPLLQAMADPERIQWLGAHGRGYVAKLLINLLWFGQAVATTEALLLAQRAGIDPAAMHSALRHSAVAGRFVDGPLAALLEGDYLTTFGLDGCVIELRAIRDLAAELGTPFTVSTAVSELYEQALRTFGPVDGELMAAALLEKQAGTSLSAG